MDGRRARLIDPLLDGVPRLQRAVPARIRPAAGTALSAGWAAALGIGWPVAFLASVALEPVPAEPEAVPAPLLIELASLLFLAALATTVVAAACRHRVAAVAGVAAGLVSVAFSVTCPVSGHHDLGLWWFGQLGLVVTMLAVSCAALGRRARSST